MNMRFRKRRFSGCPCEKPYRLSNGGTLKLRELIKNEFLVLGTLIVAIITLVATVIGVAYVAYQVGEGNERKSYEGKIDSLKNTNRQLETINRELKDDLERTLKRHFNLMVTREPENGAQLIGRNKFHKFTWFDPEENLGRDYYLIFRQSENNGQKWVVPTEKNSRFSRSIEPDWIESESKDKRLLYEEGPYECAEDPDVWREGLYEWKVRSVPEGESADYPHRRETKVRTFYYFPSLKEKIRCHGKIIIGHKGIVGDTVGSEYSKIDKEITVKVVEGLYDHFDKSIELVRKQIPWSSLLSSVGNQKVDIVLSSITKAKSRERRYGIHFSEGYYKDVKQVFIVSSTFDKIKSTGDIDDHVIIGTKRNTTNEMFSNYYKREHNLAFTEKTFDSYPDLREWIHESDINVALVDEKIAVEYFAIGKIIEIPGESQVFVVGNLSIGTIDKIKNPTIGTEIGTTNKSFLNRFKKKTNLEFTEKTFGSHLKMRRWIHERGANVVLVNEGIAKERIARARKIEIPLELQNEFSSDILEYERQEYAIASYDREFIEEIINPILKDLPQPPNCQEAQEQ